HVRSFAGWATLHNLRRPQRPGTPFTGPWVKIYIRVTDRGRHLPEVSDLRPQLGPGPARPGADPERRTRLLVLHAVRHREPFDQLAAAEPAVQVGLGQLTDHQRGPGPLGRRTPLTERVVPGVDRRQRAGRPGRGRQVQPAGPGQRAGLAVVGGEDDRVV